MTRPDAERNEAGRFSTEESPGDAPADPNVRDDFAARHARVERPSDRRVVRASSPDDDFAARHAMTVRDD